MLTWFAIALAAVTSSATPQPATGTIDCDAGQSLAQAIVLAERTGTTILHFKGTCVGNFVVHKNGLQLQGLSPSESILTAPQGTVLSVEDANTVVLWRVGVRGGDVGVAFRHGREGQIIDSEVSSASVGVVFDTAGDVYVTGSAVHDNVYGIVSYGSTVSVSHATIRANRVNGISGYERTTVELSGSQVTDNGQAGLAIFTVSSAGLYDTTFARNTDVQVFADDRCNVNVSWNTMVGSPADQEHYSMAIGGSSLFVGGGVTLNGNVLVNSGGYAEFGYSVTVHGEIVAIQFGKAVLYEPELSGGVWCYSGGDAVCAGEVTVPTSHCPSAVDCGGAQVAAGAAPPARSAELIERLRTTRAPRAAAAAR